MKNVRDEVRFFDTVIETAEERGREGEKGERERK